ncbi:hypothetical protein L3Y34_009743 [Caenorhabditis briggsae]|uniref:Uncharacterized protein n=1 Tax=Caenorhabditis briggsae TaxID=6238 RepID=A0AAE9D2S6_CAEBR|nr:hypothetical protein L3Y34_009743 [Caenorhabditis briggsae]
MWLQLKSPQVRKNTLERRIVESLWFPPTKKVLQPLRLPSPNATLVNQKTIHLLRCQIRILNDTIMLLYSARVNKTIIVT